MQLIFDSITALAAFLIAIEPLVYYVYRKRHPQGGRLRTLHVRLLGLFIAAAAASAIAHAPPTSLLPILDGAGMPIVLGATGYVVGRGVRFVLHRALARYPQLLSEAVAPMARRAFKAAP